MKGKVKINGVFRSAVPTSALGLKVSGRNGNLATGQLRCGLAYKAFGV